MGISSNASGIVIVRVQKPKGGQGVNGYLAVGTMGNRRTRSSAAGHFESESAAIAGSEVRRGRGEARALSSSPEKGNGREGRSHSGAGALWGRLAELCWRLRAHGGLLERYPTIPRRRAPRGTV